MTVRVDVEKLTSGLEDGIGRNNAPGSFIAGSFSCLPVEQRLRLTDCGLVATAVNLYARNEGLNSRLLISSPNLSYNPEEQHVTAAIEDESNSPTIIDAAASRLLDHAGLSVAYEMAASQALFPPEKVVVFDLYNPTVVVDWLVSAIDRFRHTRHQLPLSGGSITINGQIYHIGAPLFDAPLPKIRQAYAEFYNPLHIQTWTPPKHVIDAAEVVAQAIPPGAIEID